MISNSPEYLIEEVMNQYGIEVPMETVLTYLDSDPYLTPESLYDYVTRYGEEENITAIKLKGSNRDRLSLPFIIRKDGVEVDL